MCAHWLNVSDRAQLKRAESSLSKCHFVHEQSGADWDGINPLNAELNTICHLLALLGAHHILHVSRIRVNPGLRDERPVNTAREPWHGVPWLLCRLLP